MRPRAPAPTAIEDGLAALYRRPGFLLRHCHQISVAVFTEACATLDITPGQYGALTIVAGQPGIDQQTLSKRIGLDASTTGGIVVRLAARGLVLRQIGARDRRARALILTATGRRLLAACGPAVKEAQRRLLAPFAPAERQMLITLLARLIDGHGGLGRAPARGTGKTARSRDAKDR